jgi:hypothetical protein
VRNKEVVQVAGLVVLVCLLLGLVEAQFHLLRDMFGGAALLKRELATYFLGKYLADHYAGKKVVVLSNPFSERSGQPREVYRFEKAGLRGLRRGLGTAVKIEAVVFPELKPGLLENPHAAAIDPHTTTPLSYLVADDALDHIAQKYADAEILVSLIGLPVNVRKTETWKSGNGHRFALLLPDLRMVGDQAAVRQAFQSGKLAAIVLNKPGALQDDRIMSKQQAIEAEFDQRFLLVTPENVDQCLRTYPRLF